MPRALGRRAPGLPALGRLVVVLLAVGALLVPAGSAEAVWTAAVTGSASGLSNAVTLATPATATVTCSSLTTPKVTWATSPYASGYQIYRKLGTATPTLVAGGPYTGTSATLAGSLTDVIASLGIGVVITVTFMVQAVSGAADAQHLTHRLPPGRRECLRRRDLRAGGGPAPAP